MNKTEKDNKKAKFGICPYTDMLGKAPEERAKKASEILTKQYDDALCALEFDCEDFDTKAHRLLVMARLSAQCTDKRVNIVSQTLFEKYPSVKDMASADVSDIEEIIKPCGVYRMKAKNISDACRMIEEEFGGKVPDNYDDLIRLPGVGMKIANLMLGELFGDPRIVPDTHCIRISHRLGLTSSDSDPVKCERELSAIVEKKSQADFCHRLVMFGREFCSAPTPDCKNCPIRKTFEPK